MTAPPALAAPFHRRLVFAALAQHLDPVLHVMITLLQPLVRLAIDYIGCIFTSSRRADDDDDGWWKGVPC
jgi:hypothetical protein